MDNPPLNTGRQALYFGRAGHLAAMSEFLLRGWNVAIPEVDVGDDIFVVHDAQGIFRKVQVKSANTRSLKKDGQYFARFKISLNQLMTSQPIEFYYIFMFRHGEVWMEALVIPQIELLNIYSQQKLGSLHGNSLSLHFSINCKADKNQIFCSGYDFSPWLGNFSSFPMHS